MDRKGMSMRRFLVLLTVAAMMLAVMMALSGVAQAQGGDVCVSLQGETTVQMGTSTCTSDATSHAVAVNDSEAVAQFGSNAVAGKENPGPRVDQGPPAGPKRGNY